MKVYVVEVFHSFQGEGLNVGKLRTFVRLASGCPLSCKFCDSKYARRTFREFDENDAALIRQVPHVVFTGNEPTFDKGPYYILRILKEFKIETVEIETNGVIPPHEALLEKVTLWTISPKNPLLQSKQVDTQPLLLQYVRYLKNYVVKFVYNNDDAFILETVSKYKIPHEKVWIMPRGETRRIYLKMLPAAWRFAFKHRFNLSPRLHIETFDKKRGV